MTLQGYVAVGLFVVAVGAVWGMVWGWCRMLQALDKQDEPRGVRPVVMTDWERQRQARIAKWRQTHPKDAA